MSPMSLRFQMAFKFNLILKLIWDTNLDHLTPYNNHGPPSHLMAHLAHLLELTQQLMEAQKSTIEKFQLDSLKNPMTDL
jgi:hypothetical protein